MKKPLVVLTGPTAVGKTALSIKLAKALDTEIISGDSMQVYKGMDIGTAKVMPDEMQGVVHHLIDIIEPNVSYDAFKFKEMAMPVIEKLHDEGRIPLIVGGTGFYIQALAYDIDFSNEADVEYRDSLFLQEEKNPGTLFKILKEVDPEYAKITPKENLKRVVRALEFFHTTGEKLSEHNETQRSKASPYDLKYFVLTKERSALYSDIDRRVDIMMESGLLEEAKWLYNQGLNDCTAIKAIGYHELFSYFDGECDLKSAVDKIKLDTRHFAKRQLTWFRREKNVCFINRETFGSDEEILKFILEKINE